LAAAFCAEVYWGGIDVKGTIIEPHAEELQVFPTIVVFEEPTVLFFAIIKHSCYYTLGWIRDFP